MKISFVSVVFLMLLSLLFFCPMLAEGLDARINRQVELLDDDDFEVREQAQGELLKICVDHGKEVITQLRDIALNDKRSEVKFRCVNVIKDIPVAKLPREVFSALEFLVDSKSLIAGAAREGLTDLVMDMLGKKSNDSYIYYKETKENNLKFKYLKYIDGIKILRIDDHVLNDNDMKILSEKEALYNLSLNNVTFELTEEGYVSFDKLKNIRYLYLTKCYVKGLCGKLLREKKFLSSLKLSQCEMNKDDFYPLKSMENLFSLDLSRTNVGDDAMVFLEGAMSLQILNLWNSKVTDKSLESFKKMTRLYSLGLDGTAVTKKGVAEFKQTSIRCKVSHRPVVIGINYDLTFNGKGMKILGVVEGSVAEKMGIESSDIVRGINGQVIDDRSDVLEMVKILKKESDIKTVKVLRLNKVIVLKNKDKKKK